MKKQTFLIISALAIIIFSCKKSDTVPNNPGNGNTGSKIKTWSGSWGSTVYTYDNQGRLIQTDHPDGSKITYEYVPGKATEKVYNSAGVKLYDYIFDLNNDGLVVKETRSSDPAFLETSIYNSEKNCAQSVTKSNGNTDVMDYYYTNGNCDSIRFSTNGNWYLTITKTFYADKLNSLNYDAEGLSIYGRGNKNLQKTEQYTYPDGSKLDMTTYTYEFDANGRAVKKTGKRGIDIEIEYITYN